MTTYADGGDLRAMQPFGNRLDDDLVSLRESLAFANFSRSSTTWTRKPAVDRRVRQVPADVAGADDVEARRGREGIDVDVHLTAADETVLLREIVVQFVVEERLPAGRDRVARLQAGVVLVAAAADRADRAAVREDQHLGAGPLRRGSPRAHDRHERDGFAAPEGIRRGGENFLVQMRTSIFAFCRS